MFTLFIINFFVLINTYAVLDFNEYKKQRENLIFNENLRDINKAINLNSLEEKVNTRLLHLKSEELDSIGNFHWNFISYLPLISKSSLLKVLRALPKGTVLHQHINSAVNINWLIKHASYEPNLYFWTGPSSIRPTGTFHFYSTVPTDTRWKLLSDLRSTVWNIEEFDNELIEGLKFHYDPQLSAEQLWQHFYNCFIRVSGLISYYTIFPKYLDELWKSYFMENILHVELRVTPTTLYNSKNEKSSSISYISEMVESLKRFQNSDIQIKTQFSASVINTTQFSASVIYACPRFLDKKATLESYKDAVMLKEKFPDLVVGFDLVGDEDEGFSLFHHLSILLDNKLPLFLHAGETLNQSISNNLYDSILLNTSRIGHGFSLTNHPLLTTFIQKQKIPLEVCPISNQVLELVSDLRCHPARSWIRDNFPVALSGDDSALWGADGISHDFFVAFLAWDLELGGLKKLVQNSIEYSTIPSKRKFDIITNVFPRQWKHFLLWFCDEFGCN